MSFFFHCKNNEFSFKLLDGGVDFFDAVISSVLMGFICSIEFLLISILAVSI